MGVAIFFFRRYSQWATGIVGNTLSESRISGLDWFASSRMSHSSSGSQSNRNRSSCMFDATPSWPDADPTLSNEKVSSKDVLRTCASQDSSRMSAESLTVRGWGVEAGVRQNVITCGRSNGGTVIKPVQRKRVPLALGKLESVSLQSRGDKVLAILSNADAVVERHALKSLASSVLRRSTTTKPPSARAAHMLRMEQELAELRTVVAALAVLSVAHDERAVDFDADGMIVLDADTAYQLLDSPPEPSEALRQLLALR